MARLRHAHQEVFCCLFLDSRHWVLCFEEMFRGTRVHTREVVKEALRFQVLARRQVEKPKFDAAFSAKESVWFETPVRIFE